MDNFYISDWFDWKQARLPPLVRFINRLLRRVRSRFRLLRQPYTGSMMNVEQRMNLYHLVNQVLAFGVPGELIELGCFEGQSAVVIQRVIDEVDPRRHLHVYDSFEGLPEPNDRDGVGRDSFPAGFLATTKERLLENFSRYGLRPPEIHAGWFHETLPDELPQRICFAHLDGDHYDSIRISLEAIYPRLSSKAAVLIDDYCDPEVNPGSWNRLPGVKRACDEFFADKPETVTFLYSGDRPHAYFRKA